MVRRVFHCLTFGRTKAFAFESLIYTLVPIAVTLLGGAPFTLPVVGGQDTMFAGAVVLTIVFLVGAGWAVSSAGYTTYSPRFHRPAVVLGCFCLYLLVAVVLVGFAYLLLVYPYVTRPLSTNTAIAVGGVFAALFALFLGGTHYGVLRRVNDVQRKQQLIERFLRLSDDLQSCDQSEAEAIGDELLATGREIEQELREEAAIGCDAFREELGEWLDDFHGRTPAGYQKMVGGTAGPAEPPSDVDPDQYWEKKHDHFRRVHDVLHTMRYSAIRKVRPGD